MDWLAKWLGVPYLGYQGYFILDVGEHTYTMWSSHGGSGATTDGGRITAAQKAHLVADADIYLSAHVHEPIYKPKAKFYFDKKEQRIVKKTMHYCICGSFLDYFGSYGEMKAYAPTRSKPIRLNLYADRDFIYVDQ